MKRFTERLDLYIAGIISITCLIMSIIFFVTRNVLQSILFAFVLIACILYFYLRLSNKDQIYQPDRNRNNAALGIFLKSAFYLTLGISFFLCFFQSEPYSRPISYFCCIGVSALIIGIQILYVTKDVNDQIVLQIILLGIVIRWIQVTVYPGHVWFDPWFHENFIDNLIQLGRIPDSPEFQIYSKLPMLHLFTGSSMLLTGGDSKFVTIFVLIPLQVIVQGISIYLITLKIVSSRQLALIAMILATLGDTIISYGISPTPNMFAVIVIPVLVYIYISDRYKSVPYRITTIILLAWLILTHTIATLCMLIILLTFWLGAILYKNLYQVKPHPSAIKSWTVGLFFIAALSYWMYASGHFILLVKVFRWVFDTGFFTLPPPEEAAQYSSELPIIETLLDRSGYFLFYSLSVLGCLHALRKKFTNVNLVVLTLAGTVMSFLGFFGAFFQAYVQPSRWYFISQVFMSIPAAIGIMMFSSIIKTKKILVIATLGIFAFLSVSSSVINSDSPVLSTGRVYRRAYTQSELASLKSIAFQYHDQTIFTDQHSLAYLVNNSDLHVVEFTDQLVDRQFTSIHSGYVLIRDYVANNVFYTRGVIWKLDYDIFEILQKETFSKVYDSGSVSLYYSTPFQR